LLIISVDIITNIGPLPGLSLCMGLGVFYQDALRQTGLAVKGMKPGMVNLALGSHGYPGVKRAFYRAVLDLCREKRVKKG
jgi:hypothetical protein